MRRSSRTLLIAFAGLLVLAALALIAVPRLLGADRYRQQFETSGSEALMMPVTVAGGLEFRFRDGLQLLASDVRVGEEGEELLIMPQLLLNVEMLPLLRRQVVIREVTVSGPELNIIRHADGSFNFTRPDLDADRSIELNLERVDVVNGTTVFRQMSPDAEERAPVTVSNIAASARGSDGEYEIRSLTMEAFGAEGSANLLASFEGEVPAFELDIDLPQFAVEQVFASFMKGMPAEGMMAFSARLSAQGRTMEAAVQSLAGEVSLNGSDLTLYGSDLDEEFERFESSQEFSLVDVGAFFFAGPAGVLVTKGYDFASILQASGETTPIRQVVSRWSIENGIATAVDVALATEENRVAMKGALDFPNKRFEGVELALVNSTGCAEVTQEVRGTFSAPEVERPTVLESLAGPVLELLDDIRDRVAGEDECEVFYSGTVN